MKNRMQAILSGLIAAGWVWTAASLQAAPAPAVSNTPPAGVSTGKTAELRIGEAVLLALTRNRALEIQRLEPAIRKTFEDAERAVFDPVFSGDLFHELTQPIPASGATAPSGGATTALGGTAQLDGRLPTGTQLGAGLSAARETGPGQPDIYTAKGALTVTQALLQGRPIAVNLAGLRQARLDTAMSEYEFRGFTETLVADVEAAYWEYALAGIRVGIFEEALALAEKQLQEVEHRIRVGNLPETERASAQAETALRRESLINARSVRELANLRLTRLIAPDTLAAPRREWSLATPPAASLAPLDPLAAHVETALHWRPDLNQARLQLEKNEIELVKTKNGLLPKLDLFIRLGDTGYADSFGDAVGRVDGRDADLSAGVQLAYPLGNRQAKALQKRAVLSREQATVALDNMIDLARVDVEAAYIEVQRSREQIAATETTRKFQEEKLRAETAKFNVGRSTSLLVAQAQQDLVNSQVSEADAVVANLLSLSRLFRLEGSLLERRGLSAPGRKSAAGAGSGGPS